MVVERLDGSFDADDDTNNDWSTNAGITTNWHTTGIWNGFGLAMYYSTGMHNSETHIRMTVTFPEFADASKTIGLKNIGIISSYSSAATNKEAFVQDFNRNATGYGDVNIPTGHSYKVNGTGLISATQLGTTVVASSLTSVGTLTGLALSGALTTTSTIDGRDVAADGVLATNALPKAGGTLTGALTIHSATDALLNLRTGDDTWAYMQFQQNSGARRAYIGVDADLDTLVINATENGTTKIELNSTTTYIQNSLSIGGHSFDDIDIGSEFVDSDNHIMSSGAIKEKIEGYNYVTANQDTTGTAAIATTVTVADESTDTDCFPLYSTASTGNQAPKSGTNLRFNSNTGLLTATKLAGTHEATGVGATGNQSLDSATNTAAEYAALPVGYAHMMHSSLGTDEGMPLDGKYFYFTKIANRDSGGGWGGLAFAYSEPWKAYLGFTTTDGDFATWNKMLVEDASGNVTVAGTVDGRDLATDGTKLDGIEASSDVTDTTNVLSALSGDLGGSYDIGNQTSDTATFGGPIKVEHGGWNGVTVENTANTNGSHIELKNTERRFQIAVRSNGFDIRDVTASDTSRFSINSSGNISIGGTIDGRDLATDGTKLDGIASGATANAGDATLAGTQTFSGAKTFSATVDIDNSVTYKHISITAGSDALDVSGCTVVEATPSGTDRLGGLTGGVQGQILYILKVDSGFGRLIIEHNEGTGNQDIFFSGASDVTLTARGGITLYCNGTSWFVLDK